MSSHAYVLQCILLGDMRVGKSTIMQQFLEGCFTTNYEATIGIDFGTRLLRVDDALAKLQVWDILGSTSFRRIAHSYYARAVGGFIVYSVAERESFESVSSWLQEMREFAFQKAAIVIVGNQTDRQRTVSTEEGLRLANEYGVPAVEVCAKSRHQIEMLFTLLTAIVLDQYQRGELSLNSVTVES